MDAGEKNKKIIDENSALIVVDVQNDFIPGGALPVPEGDKIVPVVNEYIDIFRKKGLPIFATRDWHPENHISFKQRGGPWPPHCVQGTWGAEFHPELKLPEDAEIISKAQNPDKDAYSGFEDTELAEKLRAKGVKKVFVCGLATDYCVKNTVLDALRIGFETYVLEDAIRGVNVSPDDSEKAIEEMKKNGAKMITIEEIRKLEAEVKEGEETKEVKVEEKTMEEEEKGEEKLEGEEKEKEKKLEEIIVDLKKKFEKTTEEIAEKVTEEISEKAKEIGEELSEKAKEIKEIVKEEIETEVREKIEKTVDEVSDKLKKAVDNVLSAITQAVSRIREERARKRVSTKKTKKKEKALKPKKKEKKKISTRGKSPGKKTKKGGGKTVATKKVSAKAKGKAKSGKKTAKSAKAKKGSTAKKSAKAKSKAKKSAKKKK